MYATSPPGTGDPMKPTVVLAGALLPFALEASARGQTAAPPTGAPPPDATALVTAAKAPGDVPTPPKSVDGTSATVSAGGQLATGNSRLLAATVNGVFSTRYHDNGFGASLLGNYGEGAPPGQPIAVSAENVQGRVRYDRYVGDRESIFLMATGRNDKLQGLVFRLNLDPGFKYLFVTQEAKAVWAEVGYDFQYDIRRDDSLVEVDADR